MDTVFGACDIKMLACAADCISRLALNPMQFNLYAAAFAHVLAQGRNSEELGELMRFLQLCVSLLKSYAR